MVLIRVFEEQIARDIEAGLITGFIHLSIREEAIAAGVCEALKPSDLH